MSDSGIIRLKALLDGFDRVGMLRLRVVAGHAGPSYGVPHPATLEAIALAGRLEALPSIRSIPEKAWRV